MSDLDPYPTSLSGAHHHILPAQGSRRLVIFFGAKDLAPDKYNFFQLGRELNVHRIFVNNGENHWYQYGIPSLGGDLETTLRALKSWMSYFNINDTCTIGTSMGGYAAIQYGVAIGARVLAFSTDAKLNSPASQSAQHFRGIDPPSCSDLVAHVKATPADVTLLVGERNAVDLHAAWQLSECKNVSAYSIIGAGHILPSVLSRQAKLGPLLRAFVKGKPLPQSSLLGGALYAKNYPAKVFEANIALQKRQWECAIEKAQEALKDYPNGEAAEIILGTALIKLARWNEALSVLSDALVTDPDDTETKVKYAMVLRKVGALERSNHVLKQILAKHPNHHRSHYTLCISALEAKDLKTARCHIVEALRIRPTDKTYRRRYQIILNHLK